MYLFGSCKNLFTMLQWHPVVGGWRNGEGHFCSLHYVYMCVHVCVYRHVNGYSSSGAVPHCFCVLGADSLPGTWLGSKLQRSISVCLSSVGIGIVYQSASFTEWGPVVKFRPLCLYGQHFYQLNYCPSVILYKGTHIFTLYCVKESTYAL